MSLELDSYNQDDIPISIFSDKTSAILSNCNIKNPSLFDLKSYNLIDLSLINCGIGRETDFLSSTEKGIDVTRILDTDYNLKLPQSLTKLNLSQNLFTEKYNFSDLVNLTDLDISRCKLKKINYIILSTMTIITMFPSLTKLNLLYNDIDTLPVIIINGKQLSALPESLIDLSISVKQIEQINVNGNIINGLPLKLQKLKLTDCVIKNVIFPNLTELYLENCSIYEFKIPKNLTKISFINCKFINLSNIYSRSETRSDPGSKSKSEQNIGCFNSLKYSSVSEILFKKCTDMHFFPELPLSTKFLSIEMEGITSMSNSFLKGLNLTSLELINVNLLNFTCDFIVTDSLSLKNTLITTLSNLNLQKSLQKLHIEFAMLNKPINLTEFVNLRYLTLRHCLLSEIEIPRELVYLNLGHNNLEYVEILTYNTLKELNLEFNKLTNNIKTNKLLAIPKDIEKLNLRNNPLNSLTFYNHLRKIKELDISNVRDLLWTNISIFNTLIVLNINGCCMNITTSLMKSLKELRAKSNMITTSSLIDDKNDILEYLDISGSIVKHWKCIKELTHLKYLDISMCNLNNEIKDYPNTLETLIISKLPVQLYGNNFSRSDGILNQPFSNLYIIKYEPIATSLWKLTLRKKLVYKNFIDYLMELPLFKRK